MVCKSNEMRGHDERSSRVRVAAAAAIHNLGNQYQHKGKYVSQYHTDGPVMLMIWGSSTPNSVGL